MSPILYPASAAALLGVALGDLLTRLRRARDRRAIREDLARRRCRLVWARSARRGFRLLCGQSYDVEYIDSEDDPAQATCTVGRGGNVAWSEAFADARTAVLSAEGLPTYGQNWRG